MFMATGRQTVMPDNAVTRSWARSRALGVDPFNQSIVTASLAPAGLKTLLTNNRNLLSLARPYVDLVYSLVRGSDVRINLNNRDGVILHTVGDTDGLDLRHFGPGARRDEAAVGTNTVSLALASGRQAELAGYQYYNRFFHGLASSASPIFDEAGRVDGLVTIICNLGSIHRHTLGLSRSLAELITANKRLADKNDELNKANCYLRLVMGRISRGVLILDDGQKLLSVNDYAVEVLGEGLRGHLGRPLAELFDGPPPAFLAEGRRAELDLTLKTRLRTLSCAVEYSPINAGDGRPAGSILLFYETAKRNLEAHQIAGHRVYYRFDNLIGTDERFLALVETARVAAASNSRVLIQGESGTGKELFAQSIHHASPYRHGPFVPINCAALPRELIESELFGYAPGSFTGGVRAGRPGKLEVANRGTVFFDEIGDMPWDMQTKLLRVLQDRRVTRIGSTEEIALDVRFIFATNQDLEERVEAGLFRRDLFYRLNVFTLKLPPLRERRGDIPRLVDALGAKIAGRLGLPPPRFAPAIMDRLTAYDWPGNIRQLENVVERLVLLSRGEETPLESLPDFLQPERPPVGGRPGLMDEAERRAIETAWGRHRGNVSAMARMLGISRKTMYVKLRKYGLRK